jgi:hypothetical protein
MSLLQHYDFDSSQSTSDRTCQPYSELPGQTLGQDTNLTDNSWVYSVAPEKIYKYYYSFLHNNFSSLVTPIQLLSFIILTFIPTHCRCRGLLLQLIIFKTHILSVGLIWTSDQPVADTSTWQHTQAKNIHDPGGIRNRNPSKLAGAELCLRSRCHWERPRFKSLDKNNLKLQTE